MSTTLNRAGSAATYIPVSPSMMAPSSMVGVPLYVRDTQSQDYKLYRAAHIPFLSDDLAKLQARGVSKLFVQSQDQAALQDYLHRNLEDNLRDESTPVENRFSQLNVVVRDVLREAFGRGNVAEILDQTQVMSRQTVDMICRSDAVASKLCAVLCHDYHTFTHTANVSFMCVMLAKAIGISDREDLEAIAAGGLLHDLGKLEISNAVLTKPGKLTDDEYALIREHPTKGFLAISNQPALSFAQLMMVYQHHERLDGKGYPVGVEGDSIHPWARLCSVVDVFEALTSNRPYRSGMPNSEAFKIMDRLVGVSLDPELYACWKKTIQSS